MYLAIFLYIYTSLTFTDIFYRLVFPCYKIMLPVYLLEKTIWTDADFDLMDWHDCPVYALSFDGNNNLLFDIDLYF